jgi:hypothetical protein
MNDYIRPASPSNREPVMFKEQTLRTDTKFIKLAQPSVRSSIERTEHTLKDPEEQAIRQLEQIDALNRRNFLSNEEEKDRMM